MTKRLLASFANIILTTISFVLLLLIFPFPVYAASAFCGKDPAPFNCLGDIFRNILGLVIAGASIAFFIMILSGGLKWLTSSGDPKDLENAKGRITFAAFGLFLMILAWFILNFLSTFTGVTDILNFQIPQ